MQIKNKKLSIDDAIARLQNFIEGNRIKFPNVVKEISTLIYNEDSVDAYGTYIQKFAGIVKNEKDLNEFLEILSNLWNNLPHKSLGGRSPAEVALGNQAEDPKDKVSWDKISDVLLSIQGEFQNKVYKIIDNRPGKTHDEVINYIHLLFQRYFYTAIDESENSASNAEVVRKLSDRFRIKLPPNSQIMLRLYKTPAVSKNPHRQIRMTTGVEEIDNFPLIYDLQNRNKSENLVFYKDRYYLKIVATLSKQLAHKERNYKNVLLTLWNYILIEWWNNNFILSKTFSLKGLSELLFSAINNSFGKWSSTDMLFEIFFKKIEVAGFDLTYTKAMVHGTNNKFLTPKNKLEEAQAIALYTLGEEFCRYFLTPLVTYFPILDIYYLDPIDLGEEIELFEEKEGFGEGFDFWVSKPPSEFKLRKLGAKIWEEVFLGDARKKKSS